MQHSRKLSVDSFKVSIKERDGWFVATSEEFPELYLVHRDKRFLLDSIPESIEGLIKIKSDADVQVVRIGEVRSGWPEVTDVGSVQDTASVSQDSPWMMGIIANREEIGAHA